MAERFHDLAGTLAELKVRVRTALATELAGAIGTAVRDVLVVAIIDCVVASPTRPPLSQPSGWRTGQHERRGGWDAAHDPWDDEADARDDLPPSRRDSEPYPYEVEPTPAIPTVAALATAVQVGRWWLARHGTVSSAVGVGVLATALGFAGGPFARAALAVLAAATDLLTAESALARLDQS
ncbi:MAG: hypothetical protein C0467_32620 [Planctomycetaceae bacterium]|nr:hypothetical protein [Planctomycetaceae bacterium]